MLVGAIIWRFLSGWKRHFYDSSLLEQLMGDLSSTSLDSSRRLLGHPHNMTQLPQNKAFQRDQRVNFHGLISEVTDNPVHHILFVRSKSLSPVCTPVQDAWLLEGSTTEDFVQFSSVTQSCPALCDPMNCSMPGFFVLHYLPEIAQIHVHCVGDAIQPSHPLSAPSHPAFNLSQHQGLFQWVSSLHQVAKGLEFHLEHQSFQWIFRTDFL